MLTIYNQTDLSDQKVIPAAMQLYEGGEYGRATIKVEGIELVVRYYDLQHKDTISIQQKGERK